MKFDGNIREKKICRPSSTIFIASLFGSRKKNSRLKLWVNYDDLDKIDNYIKGPAEKEMREDLANKRQAVERKYFNYKITSIKFSSNIIIHTKV